LARADDPSDVDGAAEEGSPFVPAHGMRRIAFMPKPSGFRFYHTHVVAGATSTAALTPAKPGRCISSQRTTPVPMIAKCFWY